MALAPLAGLSGLTAILAPPAGAATGAAAGAATGAASRSGAPAGSGFAAEVGRALDGLQSTQAAANASATQAAAGSGNVADAMIAASRATLATQLTVTVTQKALDSFTAIMNMQV